jgi:protein-S-isoprenylcysteine O-methyltransferase Ste14
MASRRSPDAAEPERGPGVVAERADAVIRLVAVTQLAYYLVALAWLIEPRLAGPPLLDPAPGLALAGVAVAVLSLALMAWAFRVFGSWRVRAQIDAGHELVTSGPYALMRHPIYTGVIGVYLSTLLVVPRVGFLVTGLLIAWSFDARARAEEQALIVAFGGRYARYMGRTKRLVPRLY